VVPSSLAQEAAQQAEILQLQPITRTTSDAVKWPRAIARSSAATGNASCPASRRIGIGRRKYHQTILCARRQSRPGGACSVRLIVEIRRGGVVDGPIWDALQAANIAPARQTTDYEFIRRPA